VSLFERADLLRGEAPMTPIQARGWRFRQDGMHDGCIRRDFHEAPRALPDAGHRACGGDLGDPAREARVIDRRSPSLTGHGSTIDRCWVPG